MGRARRVPSTRPVPSGFIEPCLPFPRRTPPSGPDWVHEIKHDGYRLMARRDPIGIRLLTRNHDWSPRYPLIVEAVNRLKARSRLIDGEAFACDNEGLPIFQKSCGADAMSAMFSCTRSTCWKLTGLIYGASRWRSARTRCCAYSTNIGLVFARETPLIPILLCGQRPLGGLMKSF